MCSLQQDRTRTEQEVSADRDGPRDQHSRDFPNCHPGQGSQCLLTPTCLLTMGPQALGQSGAGNLVHGQQPSGMGCTRGCFYNLSKGGPKVPTHTIQNLITA